MESLSEHWKGLTLFVEHPDVPMDNNRTERTQRGPVVGRKNYYGSGALWSGKLAAMLFSLFATLKLHGINPRQWLTAYLEACAAAGGKAPENAADFLPWNMSEEVKAGDACPLPAARRKSTTLRDCRSGAAVGPPTIPLPATGNACSFAGAIAFRAIRPAACLPSMRLPSITPDAGTEVKTGEPNLYNRVVVSLCESAGYDEALVCPKEDNAVYS